MFRRINVIITRYLDGKALWRLFETVLTLGGGGRLAVIAGGYDAETRIRNCIDYRWPHALQDLSESMLRFLACLLVACLKAAGCRARQ